MIESHEHNGVDSPRVKTQELDGWLKVQISAPTHIGIQGEMVIVYSSGGPYSLYAYIDGAWRNTGLVT